MLINKIVDMFSNNNGKHENNCDDTYYKNYNDMRFDWDTYWNDAMNSDVDTFMSKRKNMEYYV